MYEKTKPGLREVKMKTERDRENRREEGNCRKRGSLVRHFPQSNPQFKVGGTQRLEKKNKKNYKEEISKILHTPVCIVSNDSPPDFSFSV